MQLCFDSSLRNTSQYIACGVIDAFRIYIRTFLALTEPAVDPATSCHLPEHFKFRRDLLMHQVYLKTYCEHDVSTSLVSCRYLPGFFSVYRKVCLNAVHPAVPLSLSLSVSFYRPLSVSRHLRSIHFPCCWKLLEIMQSESKDTKS